MLQLVVFLVSALDGHLKDLLVREDEFSNGNVDLALGAMAIGFHSTKPLNISLYVSL